MSMRRNCVKRFLKFNNNWDTYKSFQIQNLKKKTESKTSLCHSKQTLTFWILRIEFVRRACYLKFKFEYGTMLISRRRLNASIVTPRFVNKYWHHLNMADILIFFLSYPANHTQLATYSTKFSIYLYFQVDLR